MSQALDTFLDRSHPGGYALTYEGLAGRNVQEGERLVDSFVAELEKMWTCPVSVDTLIYPQSDGVLCPRKRVRSTTAGGGYYVGAGFDKSRRSASPNSNGASGRIVSHSGGSAKAEIIAVCLK